MDSVRLPTVWVYGSYRFFFLSGDRDEPLHIHVERERMLAKFWLSPLRLQYSTGFGRAELMKLESLVRENRELFVESWNDYFAN